MIFFGVYVADTVSYGAKCQAYLYKPVVETESDDEEEEIGEFECESCPLKNKLPVNYYQTTILH